MQQKNGGFSHGDDNQTQKKIANLWEKSGCNENQKKDTHF